jgi:Protein of unknown function (DUF2628)
MPTFTVHAPPRPSGRSADPERFVFVRDGFYFWAFVLAPLWLLLQRLWLALLGYAVVNVAIGAGLYLIGAPPPVKFFTGLLVALLVGFEAATLWRWTLARRGWTQIGFAVGDDAEAAEQRFFAGWIARKPAVPPPAAPPVQLATPVWRGPPSSFDIIGLFPEPGGRP